MDRHNRGSDHIERSLELVQRKLDKIMVGLRILHEENVQMAGELDALTAQVEATNTLEQSAIVLIEGLAAQIAAAGQDPVKLAALTASLQSKSAELAAAITANTQPPPPPPLRRGA